MEPDHDHHVDVLPEGSDAKTQPPQDSVPVQSCGDVRVDDSEMIATQVLEPKRHLSCGYVSQMLRTP